MTAPDGFVAWDEQAGETVVITRQQMVDSLMRQAVAMGRGTWAAWELERRAAEIAQGGTAGYTTRAQLAELEAPAAGGAA